MFPRNLSTPQLTGLRSVLLAARHTEYYLPRLVQARLDTRQAIERLQAVEEGLERLPRAEMRELLADPRRFRNRNARGPQWPAPEGVEGMPHGWRSMLARPETLVGPLAALLRLTTIPPSIRRIVVSSRVTTGLLPEEDREALWQRFQLPVFERLVGLDGETLAWECPAHAGLHLDSKCALVEGPNGDEAEMVLTSLAGLSYPLVRLRTGIIARCETKRCECGETSPRLVFSKSPPALRRSPVAPRARVDLARSAGIAQ
jgi:hypothetical protein